MTYNIPRWIASAGGIIAMLTALALINKDWLDGSAPLSFDHFISVPLMILAIITSHLAIESYKHNRWISCAPLAFLFVMCTALILYKSIGRQAAGTIDLETKQIETASVKASRQADIERAKERLSEAEFMRDWEAAGRPKRRGKPNMKGKPTTRVGCGRNCKQWGIRAREVQSHLDVLEGKLNEVEDVKEVHPQAEKAAKIVALFGADKDFWKHVFVTLSELMVALCFELASVVLFAVAFAPPPPPGRREGMPEVPVEEKPINVADNVADWALEYQARNGHLPSTQKIAEHFGFSRTTAWRHLKAANG